MFDWVKFLEFNNIEYITRGPNLARQNLGIQCPFCGEEDPSAHMGISLLGHGWSCWRNKSHSGRQPHRLIQKLLGCSWQEANALVGDGGIEIPSEENFLNSIKTLLGPATGAEVSQGTLTLPKEFKPLHGQLRGLGRHPVNYLIGRGYQPDDIDLLDVV